MELSVKTPFFGLNSKMINHNHKQVVDVFILNHSSRRPCFSLRMRCNTQQFHNREKRNYVPAICAVSAELKDVGVSHQSEDFSIASTRINKAKELKMSAKVSGAKTRAIFDDVFSKMVAAAQPIPGFRRVKGGKTPDIPRDILLEVLGPSKVYKQVIKKIINSTITAYIEKEGLKVGKDLRVEQSFEDLEASFEPGEVFRFDAVIQLVDLN